MLSHYSQGNSKTHTNLKYLRIFGGENTRAVTGERGPGHSVALRPAVLLKIFRGEAILANLVIGTD